jgi:hypothetical protein
MNQLTFFSLLLLAAFINCEILSGYLIDKFCWERPNHVGIDGTNLQTSPQNHKVYCLRDIQACKSGYLLLQQQPNQLYAPKCYFDTNGNNLVQNYIQSKDGQISNVLVDVTATIQGTNCLVTQITDKQAPTSSPKVSPKFSPKMSPLKSPPNPLNGTLCKNIQGGHKIEWSFNGQNSITMKFTFQIAEPTLSFPGWRAIGFNRAGQTMTGASIVLGYGNNINEYSSSGFTRPTLLGTQRITSKSINTNSNQMIFQFTRPLSVQNDNTYHAIKNEVQSLLFADSGNTPDSPTSFVKHSTAFSVNINFYTASTCVSGSTTSFLSSLLVGVLVMIHLFN